MFEEHDHKHCQMLAMEDAEIICRERGARLTDQRKQVLNVIWESHRPIKAYDILERLAKDKGRLQPPTVYRALDFLLEQRLIHRIDSLQAFMGCNHPQDCQECFFLICDSCGNADECCAPYIKDAITKAADNHAFNTKGITLEISGQCASCRGH